MRGSWFRVLLWLCALLTMALLPQQSFARAVPHSTGVAISELMWMGTDVSTADEWIEIVNTSGQEIDLSDWEIQKGGPSSELRVTMVRFESGSSISPGQYFLIANYDEGRSRLSVSPDLVTTSVSLPNSSLQLLLVDGDGNVIDQVDDGTGAPFAGSNDAPKRSMERISLSSSGDNPGNWQSSTESIGFDNGSDIFGTPGRANSIAPDPPIPNSPSPIPLLRISEILANPDGDDDTEWIELLNLGDETTLRGISLKRGTNIFECDPDVTVPPGGIVLFKRTETDLSLSNGGGVVELLFQGEVIDSLEYPETAEEVSYGLIEESDGWHMRPFCVPTPGKRNSVIEQDVFIERQSCERRGEVPHSCNVKAEAHNGSIDAVDCIWHFGDGTVERKCNPDSHRYGEVGVYEIVLEVESKCGTRVKRMDVLVEEGVGLGVGVEEGHQDNVEFKKMKNPVSEDVQCVPTISSGITITSILPNPSPTPNPNSEYIELTNTTSHPFQLCSWTLDDIRDGGSQPYVFPETELQPGEVRRFAQEETGLRLNNDGDEVWLRSAGGEVEIGVVFGRMGRGEVCWVEGEGCSRRASKASKPSEASKAYEAFVASAASEAIQTRYQNTQTPSTFTFLPGSLDRNIKNEQKMYSKEGNIHQNDHFLATEWLFVSVGLLFAGGLQIRRFWLQEGE